MESTSGWRGGPGPCGPASLEPVTVGIPLPRGAAMDSGRLHACGTPSGTRCRPRRTCSIAGPTSRSGGCWSTRRCPTTRPPRRRPHASGTSPGQRCKDCRCVRRVRASTSTPGGCAPLAPGSAFPFVEVVVDGAAGGGRGRCRVRRARRQAAAPARSMFERVAIEHTGTMRCGRGRRRQHQERRPARSRSRCCSGIHFFAGSPTVRWLVLRLRNPRKAEHPDGYWDLGSAGSVLLEDCSLQLAMAAGRRRHDDAAPPRPARRSSRSSGRVQRSTRTRAAARTGRARNHVNREQRRAEHVPRLSA